MTTSSDPELLAEAHRGIRQLQTGEGPFPGVLVRMGAGVVVRCSVEQFSGWVGWSFAGAEHVAGPVDVARRIDGHDVLLPWCTEKLGVFLARRASMPAPLANGEISTLVASLLRGLAELVQHGESGSSGEWWLTDDGRPLFVTGEGLSAWESTSGIVHQVRGDCLDRALGRVLETVERGLAQGHERSGLPIHRLGGWEDELLLIAAPRSLDRSMYPPGRVHDLVAARRLREPAFPGAAPSRRKLRLDRRVAGGRPSHPEAWRARAETWRARIAELFARRERRSAVLRAPRGSDHATESPTRTPTRRRALLVAGGAAVAVLVLGLLWPSEPPRASSIEQQDRAAAGAAESAPTPDPSAASEPSREARTPLDRQDAVADDPAAQDGDDPVAASRVLLSLIRECVVRDDAVCAEAVASGSLEVLGRLGVVLRGETPLSAEIVDSYGDIGVIRVSTQGGGGERDEIMLVIVRVAEKWLVRDAYDVADQPG